MKQILVLVLDAKQAGAERLFQPLDEVEVVGVDAVV
jgi:hypothetical protein